MRKYLRNQVYLKELREGWNHLESASIHFESVQQYKRRNYFPLGSTFLNACSFFCLEVNSFLVRVIGRR